MASPLAYNAGHEEKFLFFNAELSMHCSILMRVKEVLVRRQSRGQQKKVQKVMHEYKHGDLKTSAGKKVKSQKQAVAIALSEAGASKYQKKLQKKRARKKANIKN